MSEQGQYSGIPWRLGGRDRAGLDCVGLACLWLREQRGVEVLTPETPRDTALPGSAEKALAGCGWDAFRLEYGNVVFFADKAGVIRHVAVYVGGDRYLHILQGVESRYDSLVLLRRLGLKPTAMLRPGEVERLAAAMRDPLVGDWVTVVLLIISVALSAASSFLTPRPKVGQFKNQNGRYGFDQLITQTNSTLPLPDILGAVTVAGNSPYQSRVDKTQSITDTTTQAANKVVILGSGEMVGIEHAGNVMKINGVPYTNTYWHASGVALDPAQTKAEAVDGTIDDEAGRSSVTWYAGERGISVPVDVRAQYDRNFPIYGFNGCGYLVFRMIDSQKFQSFNLTVTAKGRKVRKFDEDGFLLLGGGSEASNGLGGDGTTKRFAFAYEDVAECTGVMVDLDTFVEASEDQQVGNVCFLNKTRAYVEFDTAPAVDTIVTVTGKFWEMEWSQNPASHLVYLLTEEIRGKGLPADRIDWASAVALRDYCDEEITWETVNGPETGPRWTCNYSLDYRKSIQEHIRAVLDACYGVLFLSNGKFVMRPRKAETSVFSFDTTNILRESFSSEMVDRSTKANQFRLFYHPSATYSSETEVVRDDRADQEDREAQIGNDGVVSETLQVPAVDGLGQAERLAETMLREDVRSRWVAEWKTTVKGLALEVGDVVDVTHPSQPGWVGKLFRVEELSQDEQDLIMVKGSEYVGQAYC
jgi:hypothetical protein